MDENEIQEEAFVFRPLNEGDLTDLLFPERLVAYTNSGASAGTFQVSFKIVNVNGKTAVRVEMHTDGVLAGVPSGTRVSALLDLSLHTLHEECSEYLELPGQRVVERRWTLQRDNDSGGGGGMRWARENRRRVAGPPPSSREAPWCNDGCMEVAAAEAVIGEAASFLIQRLLVLRPLLLGASEHPLPPGHRWRVLNVDREGALRPGAFTWLGEAEAEAEADAGVLRTLGDRQIFSWYRSDGRLMLRRIEHWAVELRAAEDGDDVERTTRSTMVDRRPSVTPSGCFCGFITSGARHRSARSQRQ